MYICASTKMILEETPAVQLHIATTSGDPRILDTLADSRHSLVRRALVDNPRIPLSVLQKLSRDPEVRIRRAAAFHPNMPEDERASILRRFDYSYKYSCHVEIYYPDNFGDSHATEVNDRFIEELISGLIDSTPEFHYISGDFVAYDDFPEANLRDYDFVVEYVGDTEDMPNVESLLYDLIYDTIKGLTNADGVEYEVCYIDIGRLLR